MENKKDIDWEQRRYEIAKDVLCGMFAGQVQSMDITQDGKTVHLKTQQAAVWMADALIYYLKNGI